MPHRISSINQTTSHVAGSPPSEPDTDKHANDIVNNKAAVTTAQEVDRIESKYWFNRLIAFCKQRIFRFIPTHTPLVKVDDLVDDLTKHNPKNPQKVLAALKLHVGRAVELHRSEDGRLGISDGKVAISTETMKAVIKSSQYSSMEMAYEYLRKGEKLPEGFLQQIILPHFHKKIRLAIQYEKTSRVPVIQQQLQGRQQYWESPEKYVNDLLKKSGIEDESKFTFERMLEFKKQLRNNVVLSIEEQKSVTRQKGKESNPVAESSQQATVPRLTEPGKTNQFIEKEDCHHIQKLASEERFFSKIHLKDIGNRIKRVLLRNKRNQMFFIAGMIVTLVIAAIFPPFGMSIGISIVISLGVEFAYDVFWLSTCTLWRRIRLIRGLKKIKRYADFDHTDFGPETDKKRKKLIRGLMYRCQHKTFTQIYNAYAELEKQGVKLKKMAEKSQETLGGRVDFEKEKARYHQRRKKLKSNLFFFDKLIEQVTISRAIIECRIQKDLELLWNEKFKDNKCDPSKRTEIFKKAAKDLVVQGHKIETKGQGWMNNVVAYLPDVPAHTTSHQQKDENLSTAPHRKTSRVLGTFKSLSQATFFRSVKKTIFMNLINLVKLLRRRATITVHDPFTVTPNLIGTSAFVGFFFLEMAASHINDKQNQLRYEKIKNKKNSYTKQILGRRRRTGREEVGTLRQLAKNEVEPMIDHLLNSIKSMENIGAILEDARKQSKIRGKGLFGAMSDEEAASLILKHAAWQQLLDREINGACSAFHRIVQEKASDWNSQIATTLSAHSKRTALALSDVPARKHMPQTTQVRGAAIRPQARGAIQQLPSEIFLRKIRSRASGKLISRFRKGEISEAKALQEIGALNNLDELLALQFWIDAALKEGGHQDEDMLKKFHRFVSYLVKNKHHK